MYMQVIPNSHAFGSLENILVHYEHDKRYLEHLDDKNSQITYGHHELLSLEYLLIGFKNTLKRRTTLVFNRENMDEVPPPDYFKSIQDIIDHLEANDDLDIDNFVYLMDTTMKNGFNLKHERKMERNEVYRNLDTERDYQDARWSTRRDENGTPDAEKPPIEWITYMEYHVNKAKDANYELDDEETLAQVRKVAALAVRCLELHGCPERVIPEEYKEE